MTAMRDDIATDGPWPTSQAGGRTATPCVKAISAEEAATRAANDAARRPHARPGPRRVNDPATEPP